MNASELTEVQKKDWNRVAPGWEKWDALLSERWAFLNHLIVGHARLRPGLKVLDIGCGTGYPALLAADIVGKQGHVTGIDLAENMVQAANRKAKSLGIAQAAFQAADATHLPFENDSFQAAISRFCFMFIPEADKAMSEVKRVLKKGGYLAAAVWSAPDKNPYLKLPVDVIKTFVEVPAPDPQAPGLFRLAKPGLISEMARKGGLEAVYEEELTGEVHMDSPEQYFTSLMDIAAPLQGLFAKLSPAQTAEAKAKILQAAEQYRVNGSLGFPFAIRLLTARKP